MVNSILLLATLTTIAVSPEGSIRTPEAARDAVRALRAQNGGNLPGPVEVVFADGTYRLAQPLRLEAQDGGTPEAPVVWKAAHRGKVVISGALSLAWRKPGPAEADRLSLIPPSARDQVLVADLPKDVKVPSCLGGSHCNTPSNDIPMAVFCGSGRLRMARWPNDGFARVLAVPQVGTFVSDSPNLDRWAKEPGLWVFAHFSNEWIDLRTPVIGVDPAAKTCSVFRQHLFFIGGEAQAMRVLSPYYVFNAFSELDCPGEWVADRERGQLWVWPVEGKAKVGGQAAEAVVIGGLVSANGLKDFVLDGFVFEKARRTALNFANVERVVVRSSLVRNTCSWGVTMRGRDCRVEGCDLTDLGEGGITLEGGDGETLAPGGNVAINNHISHIGKVFFNYRQGVSLFGVGNRAEHNLIHHVRHAAIAFAGNSHYVGWNVIHDACMDNDDAGAIYTWQNSFIRRGGTVEHNLIHMTGNRPYTGETPAIYLDDLSNEIVVRHNVINRTWCGLKNNGGQWNLWQSNVVMNATHTLQLLSTANPGRRDTATMDTPYLKALRKDIVRYTGGVSKAHYPHMLDCFAMPSGLEAHYPIGTRFTDNLFVSCGEKGYVHPGLFTLGLGTDEPNVSVGGDPGFRDYAGLDWTVAGADTPAKRIIAAAEVGKMGLFESPLRFSPAVKFGEGVAPAPGFGPTKTKPAISIQAQFKFKGPTGRPAEDAVAESLANCGLWGWDKAHVSHSMWLDPDPTADYRAYAYSFVPIADATGEVTLTGGGVPTEYADLRFVGAEPERPFADLGASVRASGKEKVVRTVRIRKGVPVSVTYKARTAR